MLLPTTLPTTRSLCPARLDETDTASSGELVPRATMVRPMISGDRPTAAARREAPRTNSSAPTISNASPRMKKTPVVKLTR
jgi:hypothetical protein